MKKFLMTGFMILVLVLISFAQNPPNFKIEDFVLAKAEVSKTAIFIGDRFELKIEVFYPKGWGIRILTEDLEKNSLAAALPESVVLEEAEISKPIPWNKYWLKIEAVYKLFYPEKKHKIGILFFPRDLRPFKVRFKWIDVESKKPQEDLKVYEVDVRPGQFLVGVRTTLTDTSRSPRDSKLFAGNFSLKWWFGLFGGIILIGLALFIPLKALVVFIRGREAKEIPISQLLENEYRKLKVIREITDLRKFNDSFCLILRNLIGIKTGLKTLAMTANQIRQEVAGEDEELVKLINLLEKVDDSRYNPDTKLFSKKELLETVEGVFSNWLSSDNCWRKIEVNLRRLVGKIRGFLKRKR